VPRNFGEIREERRRCAALSCQEQSLIGAGSVKIHVLVVLLGTRLDRLKSQERCYVWSLCSKDRSMSAWLELDARASASLRRDDENA